MKKIASLLLLFIGLQTITTAAVYKGDSKKKDKRPSVATLAAGCSPATDATELDINNIRALIQTGGDMWWNLIGQPQYEVPKNSGSHSLFAGSLWLGGKDVSGQLKVAALRFRQVGNDYWPGPLSTETSEIDAETCSEYDDHFVTTRSEVAEFNGWFEAGLEDAANGTTKQSENYPGYSIPRSILEWPAHGRNFDPYNEDFYLAPFNDRNGDGVYNPLDGDFPGYDLTGEVDCRERIVNIYGDQNLWWVFNDKGNIHTETGALAIGMEIRAQAFAFATNDEVNNMTFYNYELVNRSTFTLTETYFGQWVDADLGNAQDDYVGCDVQRGLGYAYNGDENDEDNGGARGYGNLPPAIGVDFFQGPFQDNDGLDNPGPATNSEFLPFDIAVSDGGIPYKGLGVGYGDGIVDNERFGMAKFLYHNNDRTVTGDPRTGVQYYNYLRSIWLDGSHMVYGGTGNVNSVDAPYIEAQYMFPGETDEIGWGTGGQPQPDWTEITAGNTPGDRRFMQSAGPFTLEPGAVNNITVGVVWARAKVGNAQASIDAVRKADDKTQALFDNCFRVLNGPDAPDVEITELDKELILTLNNRVISNNFNEAYEEVDPSIIPPDSLDAQERLDYQAYRFQGYLIYQVKNNAVSASDLTDPDLARLVAQCDISDSVDRIVNYNFDDNIGASVPSIEVEGANEGIRKSFRILSDQFAQGDNRLVNHKTYYFIAIAYAYNNYADFDPANDDTQNLPFLGSRKSATGGIRVNSGIPHDPRLQNDGMILNAQYGDRVPVVRVEGTGNGGNFLQLEQKSIDAIMTNEETWSSDSLFYTGSGSPVNIKVIDPLNIADGQFSLRFVDTTDASDLSDAYWQIFGEGIDTISSTADIAIESEFLVPELGISVSIGQALSPGKVNAVNNGFIGTGIAFDSTSGVNFFIGGVPDGESNTPLNWILAGTNNDANAPEYDDWNYETDANGSRGGFGLDNDEVYENIFEGTWAPYRLTASGTGHGPMIEDPLPRTYLFDIKPQVDGNNMLNYLSSIDFVFTPDKSKWTRVPVVEMRDTVGEAEGGAVKGRLRESASVDKDGNPAPDMDGPASSNPDDANYISAKGMSWFPGYAINVETGERLNIAFGEDSYLIKENGRDMQWNPTSNLFEGPAQDFRGGGKHYVFVFRNNDVEDEANLFPMDFNDPDNRMPSYDEGRFMHSKLSSGTPSDVRAVWRACMWTYFPLMTEVFPLLSMEDGVVPQDIGTQVRVAKEYATYGTGDYLSNGDALTKGERYYVAKGPVVHNGTTYTRGASFVADGTSFDTPGSDKENVLATTVNGGLPLYNFDLSPLAPKTGQTAVLEELLDKIYAVPNPYYAYSQYESDKLDSRIKIINLPQRASIKIFTVDGTLVRSFEKDDPTITSLDWDLKNSFKTPIASGVYLIHIDIPGVGQKVIKWFGVLRPIDLDNF